jgi:two-component system, OmpR family, sensor histidine kinase ChvG
MARAIALARSEPVEPARQQRATSLTSRILAINIFVIVLLVAGFLYLDSYRTRLVGERLDRLADSAMMLDAALRETPADRRNMLILAVARTMNARVRVYDASGNRVVDSFALGPPTFSMRDPENQPINRRLARGLDRALDWIVGAATPQDYVEPTDDQRAAWPELVASAARPGVPGTVFRFAPDRTPLVSAAYMGAGGDWQMLITANARDITHTVRDERLRFGLALAAVTLASILLSLFLARTIVTPLRRLASAATRVRMGRAREVVVPRLPDRRDEIGTLARALSDMTGALRARIDAGEHLAADIVHELKNPLASLRSALEGLERIEAPELKRQLMDIANDDVRRLDRLITDISEASRVDAELSRSRFRPIDIGQLIEPILDTRRARAKPGDPAIAFARPRVGTAQIMGEPSRLARAIENLIDNALSFSPHGGVVRIGATCAGQEIVVRIEDDGPGVPADQRELIFRRFHSLRPDSDGHNKHSGLGLAIARAIVEGHDGTISVADRDDAAQGACFEIRIPATTACDE